MKYDYTPNICTKSKPGSHSKTKINMEEIEADIVAEQASVHWRWYPMVWQKPPFSLGLVTLSCFISSWWQVRVYVLLVSLVTLLLFKLDYQTFYFVILILIYNWSKRSNWMKTLLCNHSWIRSNLMNGNYYLTSFFLFL